MIDIYDDDDDGGDDDDDDHHDNGRISFSNMKLTISSFS